MNPWLFSRLLLLPITAYITIYNGSWWAFTIPVACFIIHPLLNVLIKNKTAHDHHAEIGSGYRVVALIHVPVLLCLTTWAIYFIAGKGVLVFLAAALSVGIINGALGFTLAHEFIHSRNRVENTAGYMLLLQNFYMHYGIEHIGGHHVYACTPSDPHTARKGETFYHFLPKAIIKTFSNAIQIEKHFMRKHKRRINRIHIFIFLQLLLLVLIYVTAGTVGLSFYLLQSSIAIAMLHNINYLQHYGLMRLQNSDGQFERIHAHHAWNTANKISTLSLFQLENHADHHLHPAHSYEQLKELPDSPTYPTGYSGMMLLTLVPPLWFKITDKDSSSKKIFT